MIVDYRIYATLYALGAIAWVGGFLMISRAKPGAADFWLKLRQSHIYMVAVAAAVVAVGFANFVDWLWA